MPSLSEALGVLFLCFALETPKVYNTRMAHRRFEQRQLPIERPEVL